MARPSSHSGDIAEGTVHRLAPDKLRLRSRLEVNALDEAIRLQESVFVAPSLDHRAIVTGPDDDVTSRGKKGKESLHHFLFPEVTQGLG
jgi:hypothetical protein